jgi:hypothetical protein
MLAKRKKQLASLNSSQSAGDSSSSVSVVNGSNNVGRKSAPPSYSSATTTTAASTFSPGGVALKGVAIKREENSPAGGGVVSRRSVSTLGPRQSIPPNGFVLDELIPSMKDTVFSPDATHVQKTRELRKLLHCMADWGSVNVSLIITQRVGGLGSQN